MRLCTVTTKDRLPWARVLAGAWAEHHPQQRPAVLLVDEPDGCFDPAAEPFDVLRAEDVVGPELGAMALRYTAAELTAALKPWLLIHELERYERVVHLDGDILVTAPLEPVETMLERCEIVLAPRLLDPIALAEEERLDELEIAGGGAYDAGFLALRRGEQSRRLLGWLTARSFVDPRRLDLVPAMFGGVGLLDDRGCDVAHWNVAERPLGGARGALTAAGVPLRFLHFSGFDPDQPGRIGGHGAPVGTHDELLRGLCERYGAALEAAGVREARSWPYSWASTAGGIALTPQLRKLLDIAQAPRASIFTSDGERTWLEWLNAPADAGAADGVTRFLAALHASRADLRERFGDLHAEARDYMQWIAEHGADEVPIPPALLAPRVPGDEHAAGLHDVGGSDDLGLGRGETIVCIPLYGAHELFVRCLTSVLDHTPRSVTILVADDADPDPAGRRFADELARSGSLEHRLLWRRGEENLGFVENVNAAFSLSAPADVLVINSDCVVGPGWFEGMRAAAYDDTNVATATALTNHGTIVSVPTRNIPRHDLPQDQDFLASARKLRSESLRLRPRIPTCVGHCMFIRRDALELVGPFDPAFSPAYGEEVDFSQRCTLHGLVHVAADDVLVLHRQGGSLREDGEANPLQAAHNAVIASRYPFYDRLQNAAGTDDYGPLARSIRVARRSLAGMVVTIDGRCLGPIVTGTQLHVIELIAALDRTEAVRLRVVVMSDLGDYARDALESAPTVTLLEESAAWRAGTERSAVMHRPLQVGDAGDLRLMNHLAERAVITQQDLIAYRNPGYFPGYPQYARYRSLARRALTFADAVVFFSHHAARDAVRENLVEPERARVVHIGVDHRTARSSADRRTPDGCDGLGQREMLLCLGTDFRHKNRLFALRLVEQLQLRHDWQGRLVLAGPRVQDGSSAGDEAAFLATRPRVADAVVKLPAVGEAEKNWLYDRATALLCPTVYEGFGLMPFEAADFGVPALWSPQASLGEVLPPQAATLVAWDPEASADAVITILRDPVRGDAIVAGVRRAAERFRWDKAARELVAIYEQATTSPAREARVVAMETNGLELERAELERKYAELLGGFTEDGGRLVGSGGLLSAEQQWVLRRALERRLPLSGLAGALRLVGRLTRPRSGAGPEPRATAQDVLSLHWEWLNRRHMDEQLGETDPQVLGPELS